MNNDNEMSFCQCPSDSIDEMKKERKYLSSILFSFTLASIIPLVLTALITFAFHGDSNYGFVTLAISELYLVGVILLFMLLTKKHRTEKIPAVDKMSGLAFLKILCISIFLMISGSLIASGTADLVSFLTGYNLQNILNEITNEAPAWMVVAATVIAAPLLEEFLFRKIMIGKLAKYGTVFSVVLSGVVFGAYHYNVFQLFYGVFLGIMLGYVYVIYGKLRYTIILHAIINFIGSVPALCMEKFALSENHFFAVIVTVYTVLYIIAAVAGAIFTFRFLKMRKSYDADGVLVAPSKAMAGAWGFWIFVVFSLFMFVTTM